MTTEIVPNFALTDAQIERSLGFAPAEIEAKRAEYALLKADTPAGYREVQAGITECRSTRGAIEERRKTLKAPAVEYGKRVDFTAKTLTALVDDIEAPLLAEREKADAEKARVKAEKEAAERARVEAELRSQREAEEARLRAEREAEEQRLAAIAAEQQRERAALEAERRRFAEEQARLDAERRAREAEERQAREAVEAELRAQRAALEAERRQVEEARRQAELAEARRQAQVEAEQAAMAKAEAFWKAQAAAEQAEQAAEQAAKLAAEERARLEAEARAARAPDLERLVAYADALRAVPVPEVRSEEAGDVLLAASAVLGEALEIIDDFCVEQARAAE